MDERTTRMAQMIDAVFDSELPGETKYALWKEMYKELARVNRNVLENFGVGIESELPRRMEVEYYNGRPDPAFLLTERERFGVLYRLSKLQRSRGDESLDFFNVWLPSKKRRKRAANEHR